MVGKRHVIDSKKFLKEQSILKLSKNPKIDYNNLLGMVSKDIITENYWNILSEEIDMRRYWIREDERNTLMFDNDSFEQFVDEQGQNLYRKSVGLSNLWNISKKFKTLGDYLKICEYFGIPYSKFVDKDDDYYPILKKKKVTKTVMHDKIKSYGENKTLDLLDSEYRYLERALGDGLGERIMVVDAWAFRRGIVKVKNAYGTIKNWGTETV